MKNKIRTDKHAHSNLHAWPWYKVWGMTLLHPTTATGKALLSEGQNTFPQAVIWLLSATFLYSLIIDAISFVRAPALITPNRIILSLLHNFIIAFPAIIGVSILTASIHFIAKLFGSRATWKKY